MGNLDLNHKQPTKKLHISKTCFFRILYLNDFFQIARHLSSILHSINLSKYIGLFSVTFIIDLDLCDLILRITFFKVKLSKNIFHFKIDLVQQILLSTFSSSTLSCLTLTKSIFSSSTFLSLILSSSKLSSSIFSRSTSSSSTYQGRPRKVRPRQVSTSSSSTSSSSTSSSSTSSSLTLSSSTFSSRSSF
jgi:hypothetical protein